VGELEVQALATGVGRYQDAGLLGEALLDSSSLVQVHRAVEADDREALLFQELPEHPLRGDELGEDQELQLRVVLHTLVVVEDVEQGLGTGVGTLGFATAGQIEEEPHLFLLILQTGQANLQQVLPLLLGVFFAQIVLGRLLVDVALVGVAVSRSRNGAASASTLPNR